MAETRGYSFEYDPDMPNLVPKCNGNAALRLASSQSLILDNDEAMSELESDLVEASHFAACVGLLNRLGAGMTL